MDTPSHFFSYLHCPQWPFSFGRMLVWGKFINSYINCVYNFCPIALIFVFISPSIPNFFQPLLQHLLSSPCRMHTVHLHGWTASRGTLPSELPWHMYCSSVLVLLSSVKELHAQLNFFVKHCTTRGGTSTQTQPGIRSV